MSDLHNDARIPLNSETVHNLLLAAEDVMSRYSVPEEYALQRLMESLEGRESNALNIPCGVPMVQASARYFVLLETATEHLKGRFSSAEFDLLLNAQCTPVWTWEPSCSLAGMVADAHGIEELEELDVGNPLRVFLERLLTLSPLENAVLVDACEQVWRGHPNPLL